MEKEVRMKIIKTAHKFLKKGGELYMSIYKAPKSKKFDLELQGQQSGADQWQTIQPLSFYKAEVEEVFGSSKSKQSTVIAKK